jgi:hypothetical protein
MEASETGTDTEFAVGSAGTMTLAARGAPTPTTADDDATAIAQAEARLEGDNAYLMDGDRLVKRISPKTP